MLQPLAASLEIGKAEEFLADLSNRFWASNRDGALMLRMLLRTPAFVLIICGFICTSCISTSDVSPTKESGGYKGNSLYSLSPGFGQNVVKWIPYGKIDEFTAFMTKWDDPPRLSDKDKIDIFIQLGILKYEPQWLTQRSATSVNTYYGKRTKRADGSLRRLRFAYNETRGSSTDAAHCCAVSLAQADVFVEEAMPDVIPVFDELFGDAVALGNRLSAYIGQISLNRPAISQALQSGLTPAAQEQIGKAISAICTQEDCTKIEAPPAVPPAGNAPGQSSQDPCGPLIGSINSVTTELKQRSSELVQDKLGLPAIGRMSIAGHKQQFQNKQTYLRRLLQEADAKGCRGYNPDALAMATMSTPG